MDKIPAAEAAKTVAAQLDRASAVLAAMEQGELLSDIPRELDGRLRHSIGVRLLDLLSHLIANAHEHAEVLQRELDQEEQQEFREAS